jgi:hypothetical protein
VEIPQRRNAMDKKYTKERVIRIIAIAVIFLSPTIFELIKKLF